MLTLNDYYAWMSATGIFCNLLGQWIYIWGYWKVANLVHALENDRKLPNPCIEDLKSAFVGLLLFINCVLAALTRQAYKPDNNIPSEYPTLYAISWDWIPTFFVLIETLILCVAVYRVRKILEAKSMVSLNDKLMVINISAMILLFVAQFMSFIWNQVFSEADGWYVLWSVYHYVNFFASAFMAFVMW